MIRALQLIIHFAPVTSARFKFITKAKPKKDKTPMTPYELPEMPYGKGTCVAVDDDGNVVQPKPKKSRGSVKLRAETYDQLTQVQEPSVALMLQKVIDGGITADNVSAIESLVGLYDRIQAKNAEREFNQAFAKFQSELPAINATKIVPDKQGITKYKYAPFEEIMDVVKPVLVANGFSVSFNSRFMEGGRIVSICTLRHVGGHSISNEFAVRIGAGPPHASEPQADGSAKNYAKRGAFCDAINLVVEHDDDARMIGQPIREALAEDLEYRVKECGADREAFLKYAGAKHFSEISDERWPVLDELLKRKEAAKAAREKLSPEGEQWK